MRAQDRHRELMEQFDTCFALVADERDQAERDMQFAHKRGAQWDDWAKTARGDRPRPEVNLILGSIKVVTGEQKQSRITSKVRATGGGGRERIATVFEGLLRSVTMTNSVKAARDKAFDEAAVCGIGAYYIDTRYESDDSLNVEPHIKPIKNARRCVFWTCDGDDSLHRTDTGCYYIHDMPRAQAKKRWPHAKACDENFKGKNGPHKGWSTKDTVRIADYWERERYEATLALFENAASGETKLFEVDAKTMQVVDELSEEGWAIKLDAAEKPKSRKVERWKVMHYVLSGSEILEGPNEFPCFQIPVCMVYGYEYDDDEGTHHYGMVRHAIDPQRKLNYEVGAMMEASAKSAKDPVVATRNQLKGEERAWGMLGPRDPNYLYYNHDPKAPGPPQRLGAPAIQGALNLQLTQSEEFIKMTTGIHSPGMGESQSGQSGRAVLALQAKGDTSTYSLKDSLANAVNYEAECLIDIFQKTLDHETQLRIVRDDDETEDIRLVNEEVTDEESGEVILLKDFRLERYDVTTDIGPSYATKRVENLNALTQLAGQIPVLGQIAPDIIAGELDITKAGELKERLRRMQINAGVVDPTDEDLKKMVEAMQRMQQLQQAMAPQRQQDPMEQMAMALQGKKLENEVLLEAAKIDETIANRVKDLTDSLDKLREFERTPQIQAAIDGIAFEIQQALTSNDQPQQAGQMQQAG